jgi:hypothetical protein
MRLEEPLRVEALAQGIDLVEQNIFAATPFGRSIG